MFSRFDTKHACDTQTNRQTNGNAVACIRASIVMHFGITSYCKVSVNYCILYVKESKQLGKH